MASLQLRPFASGLGAAVGLTVRAVLRSPQTFSQLRSALVRHKLLLFEAPGEVSAAEQVELGRRFGEVQVHPSTELLDNRHPEITWISNVSRETNEISKEDAWEPSVLSWHTDSSHSARPSLFSLLFAVEVGAGAGGTQFVDTTASYATLPPSLRSALLPRDAVHNLEYSRTVENTARSAAKPGYSYPPPSVHPIIRRHPETGEPAVYLGAHAASVVGLGEEEGRALIDQVNQSVTSGPEVKVHTHHWREGELLIWDNRALLHRAMPWDVGGVRRIMRRVVVLGDEERDRPRRWSEETESCRTLRDDA